jgi:tetratricopeptide (TPR) repeat protein
MPKLQQYKEDYILFTEAGFIAVNQADEDSSTKLFKSAKLLDPKNILPVIGQGYLHLHKLELKQAIHYFEEAIKMDPSNEMAKTFLGIALSFSSTNVAKGEKILEATQKSHDKSLKQLSHTALDFIQKFVKKTPSPAQGQKKKK